MAPLSPTLTGRLFVGYNDGQHDHDLLCRFNSSLITGVEEAMDAVDAFLSAIEPVLYDIAITHCRWTDVGSNITSPIVWTGAPTYGDGAMPAVFAPRQWMWLGRSVGGRRFRLSIFGINFNTPDTFRVASAGSNFVEDGYTVLQTQQGLGRFVCIDTGAANMYQYVDVQFNSHWETAARG